MKFTLFIFLFLSVSVYAEDDTARCDQKKADKGEHVHLSRCIGFRQSLAKEELELILAEFKKNFWDKNSIESMENAQLVWLKFVKLDCEFQKPNHGGREWILGFNSCITKHYQLRVDQLKSIPSCGGGCIH